MSPTQVRNKQQNGPQTPVPSMTKGILKRHSLSGVSVTSSLIEPSATQDDSPRPKRVSFDGAEPARVFEADEWDRSPAEVTLRLTYK